MLFAVFAKNVKQQLMYRSNFLMGILGSLLMIYIQICIWQALLSTGSGMASPVSAAQMVTYVVVSYVLRYVSSSHFTYTFAEKVNRGDIAIDLIRPRSMKNMLIAEQLSDNACSLLFSCLPVVVFAALLWGLDAPGSWISLLYFLISALLAAALRIYMNYIAGLLVFWTRDGVYTSQFFGGLWTIFSGSTIPLWFYPGWLAAIGRYLPFRLMSFEPIQIFMGSVDARGALEILWTQALWLLVLYGVERLIWLRVRSHVFVQGG